MNHEVNEPYASSSKGMLPGCRTKFQWLYTILHRFEYEHMSPFLYGKCLGVEVLGPSVS